MGQHHAVGGVRHRHLVPMIGQGDDGVHVPVRSRAPLSEGDVRLGRGSLPVLVQVCIKASKTDPFR